MRKIYILLVISITFCISAYANIDPDKNGAIVDGDVLSKTLTQENEFGKLYNFELMIDNVLYGPNLDAGDTVIFKIGECNEEAKDADEFDCLSEYQIDDKIRVWISKRGDEELKNEWFLIYIWKFINENCWRTNMVMK